MSGISEESVKKNETLVDTHGLKLLTFKTVFFFYIKAFGQILI